MPRPALRHAVAALAALVPAFLVPAAHAGEGMWMPQQVPLLADELKAKGFALDPAQVTDLLGDPMGAIVSLGGCTASFVSPQGLIATNHHCVYQTIQFNSTAERDLLTQGFLANTTADELPTAPGTYVYVTSAIRDVTAEVLAAVAPKPAKRGKTPSPLTDLERAKATDRRGRELVDACEKPGGVRCTLGSFFEGTQYLLITQQELKDVRLVYAPAMGIGNYGGEVDNWMWPRHTGDFAFLRAYVGPSGAGDAPAAANVPYAPKHWLKVAAEGVKEHDLVWIAGYPGRTFRYQTPAEVVEARDFAMPRAVEISKAFNALLEEENKRGKEVELSNYARIRGNANRLKKFEGILATMTTAGGRPDPVETQRRAREARLAERAAQGGQAEAAAVAALQEIDRLYAAKLAQRHRDVTLDWLERASPMVSQAYRLYRLSLEKIKPDLDRVEEYRERNLSRFDQAIARTQRSIEPASDRAGLRYWLKMAADLPADQRIAAVDQALAASTGSKEAQIEALLDRLYAGTKVADLAQRQAMRHETTAQLEARNDSLVFFAKALLPELMAREAADKAWDGAMLRLRPTYLEGLKALEGGRLYPDANSTLRVTFCDVEGSKPRDGVANLPQTSLQGLVAKATGTRPFDAPASLLQAAREPIAEAYRSAALGGDVPVNFLATCDTTGGNSGSAVLNAKGELVALAFDGVWEGVVSDYLFLDDRVRGIMVDVLFLRWVMDQVDGAHHLLKEMGLPVYAKKD